MNEKIVLKKGDSKSFIVILIKQTKSYFKSKTTL